MLTRAGVPIGTLIATGGIKRINLMQTVGGGVETGKTFETSSPL